MVVPTVFNPASEACKAAFCIAILSIKIYGQFHTKDFGPYLVFLFIPHSIILNETMILTDNQKHVKWKKIPSSKIWSI